MAHPSENLSEKQKKILVFHSDFGCLEGGCGEHLPPAT